MISVLSAIIPIVAILLLGKAVSATKILSDEGWDGLESITYYVLFPALIISKLAVADFSGLDWRMPATLIGAQLAIALLTVALGKISKQPANRLGVFVQSGVRWNTFIALAIAQDVMGPVGVVLVAAAAAAMVPTANLLSIVALIGFSNGTLSASQLTKQVLGNPLILAFIVGIAINLLGIGLAPSVLSFFDILAQAAIAMGLLASGTHIQLRSSETPFSLIFLWSMLRLLGLPLIAGGTAFALGVPAHIFLVILIATAVPTASNGAILARKLGGDTRLAANLIAFQTVLALVTVVTIFWGAETLGLI